ncbi:preprotein translocase subunit SecA [Rhodopirellula maiorica SM1]|uniref:Protein translocase subunit SecA n=1 Tax=Rhodopirellula maiorica SM1 TaxID=1265738 RepID=M5S130_9BACT|nr:DEAD/DEAH box helicase [Rhodopirellula maiorica]EMI21352.1 preprotein translocase subunit SecA [Rhodopirellula maiorica SM1]
MIASFWNPTIRSTHAAKIARRIRCDDWVSQRIAAARECSRALKDASVDALVTHTHRLRIAAREQPSEELLTSAAAAVIESIRQTFAIELFDVQLHAGFVMASDAVAEMQTGEGKTLSAVLPAYLKSLLGRGVHVITPNSYLAQRDQEKLEPVFARLGVTTGILADQADPSVSRKAYQADVTYGPAHAFGFDYLRDQISNGDGSFAVYDRIQNKLPLSDRIQRPLHAAIIDEIDNVLIDDAVSPMILSSRSDQQAADAELHRIACVVANRLECDRHYVADALERTVSLTESGFQTVYKNRDMAVHPQLVRPWHEYVTLAIRIKAFYRRDVDYVVSDRKIRIVDASTGRIFEDRTWSGGLHQAAEAAERLPVTTETRSLARITRQRYFRYYQSIAGMTGTARGCEREFASVYGLAVQPIPLRIATRRVMQPDCVTRTMAEKWQAIAKETRQLHELGRPVLIGTSAISESKAVADALENQGLTFALLNGVQDADEASVIRRAGQTGAITVATNLAGRGTDIALDSVSRELGGLHVIVTQRSRLARVDRQLIGRGARCGDPGSARIYISAEDDLIRLHAPWIARSLLRSDASDPHSVPKIQRQLKTAQTNQQRRDAGLRLRLLKQDHETATLLRRQTQRR